MRILYSFVIHAYSLAAFIASFFNEKARLWIHGRKDVFTHLREKAGKSKHWVWFHAASLGEFEQGRPVIEALKKERPDLAVLLTFFSPSGYEIRKDYAFADCVAYLPADTLRNAGRISRIFHFEAVFFIKYEFWFNYLHVLQQRKIPVYFISARFRPGQHFFQWYGGWFRKHLRQVNHFFVQEEVSATLLSSIGIKQFTVTGDTRFDRVAGLALQAARFPLIEVFKGEDELFIAGSSWPEDERLLIPALKTLPANFKIIIAPHDVSPSHVQAIRKQTGENSWLYSQFGPETKCNILIVDSVGILSQLYQYARFVYIGGGFGKNIHNIQEPVTFGCPVIFGPKYGNFTEAVDLQKLGGAFTVNDAESLETILKQLASDNQLHAKASAICKNYVGQQIGATEKIMQFLRSKLSASQD
jgi:3-deoxy-D-manno-octulosonic-acid transferase